MAHLRDRRAFGNIGTRKFRGARFGDSLSPRGPQYTKDGRVLDYSTDVGPFTIIDQSGESNTATLYSGRGLTMDAVNDTVTYDTTYSSAERTATVWMRVTALGARTLNGATGTFTFTPTATNTWEELSSTATVSGDLAWTAGSDCDIGDLTCATEHWTHNDWSDPTGDTSNGKTIVDSGANQLHGTCTGCSGFTGEATIPQTADKNWNKYQWFNGTDTHIAIAHSTDFNRGGAELRVSGRFTSTGISAIIFDKRTVFGGNTSGFFVGINANGFVTSKVYQGNISNGDAVVSSSTYDDGLPHQFELVINNSTISIAVDGSDIDSTANTGDVADSANDLFFGKNTNPSSLTYLAGTVWDIDWSVGGVSKASYTGLGNDPWKDTIGSNDGTEAGTFTSELVSASDANDQIDALGTAILEPRLNTQQLNLFGEGEYSSTPDSASLDLTTEATWEIWGNFYGVPATSYSVLSKYDTGSQRSWWVGKSSLDLATEFKMQTSVDGLAATTLVMGGLSDKVSQLVVTFSSGTLLAYVDGVAVTVTGTSGSSLFNSSAPVMIGTLKASGVNALLSNNKIGSTKIYNVALTADEVLTNYNTQKSLYGLPPTDSWDDSVVWDDLAVWTD